MKAIELSPRPPVTIDCSDTVHQAAVVMAKTGVGALIVLDAGVPVGVVTDRDIVTRGVAHRHPADARIDGLMSMGLIALDVGDELEDVMHAFEHHAVRRLPVVDGSEVVGVVSLDDVITLLVNDLAHVSKVVAAQIMFPHANDEAAAPSRM
ncbi:MAG: CBS domain-containing protein [Acidimicrobiia bacterium]|nr:CBS domain-containing protein [Acidimicrobiia bacterium]